MARHSNARVENHAAFKTKRVGGGVADFDAIKLMKFAAS